MAPLVGASSAFGVRSDQITGPAWLNTERYDIVANIPEGATRDDFRLMLADLLRDRFRLRFHMDSQIRPIYSLRAGKTGSKFKLTVRSAGSPTVGGRGVGGVDPEGCPNVSPDFQGIVSLPVPGVICWTAQDVLIEDLARLLEQPSRRPVIDETGLTGRYDFRIRFQFMGRTPDTGAVADLAPTVFTAVEEQLGLKLEPATRSFPELVIDSLEREPTEN